MRAAASNPSTARRLAVEGFDVVVAARRIDRLEALAGQVNGRAVELDVTSDTSVARLAEAVPECSLLINNAGGAIGREPVEQARVEDWQRMYDVNVLGVLRVTQALLPALSAWGQVHGSGHVVVVSSTAARTVYEGGAGYTAAKHAAAAVTETLRLELNGRPVRITEIAPGMTRTEEFSLNRFRGDRASADAVYAGIDAPLAAEDVADCIAFAATRPPHVDIDLLVVKPMAQAAPHKIARRA